MRLQALLILKVKQQRFIVNKISFTVKYFGFPILPWQYRFWILIGLCFFFQTSFQQLNSWLIIGVICAEFSTEGFWKDAFFKEVDLFLHIYERFGLIFMI